MAVAGFLSRADMLEDRNVKADLLALGLLALTIFLAASLLSFHPADPPSTLVHPPGAEVQNLCGRSGAVVAWVLFEALGVGAYYLLASLAALDVVLLARRPLGQPVLRAAGWLVSLAGISTLAAMALGPLGPGPVIGAGGYLGATGRGLLEPYFARVGAYIFTLSTILAGLLLCSDYLVVRLAALAARPVLGLGGGVVHVLAAYGRKLCLEPVVRPALATGSCSVEEAEGPEPRIVRHETDEAGSEPTDADEPDAAHRPEQGTSSRSSGGFASLLGVARSRRRERRRMLDEIEAAGAVLGDEMGDYELPSLELLLPGEPFRFERHEKEVRRKARILERTFADFGFQVRVVEIQTGPVIAQFEVELEAGLRLSKIASLADDLAIALRVPTVRIVAPIPGKNTVGIEVPNNQRQLVRLREVIEQGDGQSARMHIPLFLGKDVAGHPLAIDLATLPHLLIAGRTGTGKSVCLNSIIASILMTRRPDEVRLLLVDPKMVELSPYKNLPHLMHPVVTDMRKAEAILAWAVEKMEQRYELLARAGVRHLSAYNQLGEEELLRRIQPADEAERAQIPLHMPYVVIVADELADLMMTAAKEVEAHIIRLAQKSRAVGIHLVLATQKPTVDVITGLIKSNLPARISFQVASRTDSRVVLDEMGAERLLGNGDMLFLWPGTSTLIRGQGTFLSDDEINRLIAAVATSEPQFVTELVELKTTDTAAEGPQPTQRDELYQSAAEIVIREGRGSVSLLQRTLGIGYGRAARLIDFMAEDGIVGPYNGSQAREVLLSLDQWEERHCQPALAASGSPAHQQAGDARALVGSAADRGRLPFAGTALGPAGAGLGTSSPAPGRPGPKASLETEAGRAAAQDEPPWPEDSGEEPTDRGAAQEMDDLHPRARSDHNQRQAEGDHYGQPDDGNDNEGQAEYGDQDANDWERDDEQGWEEEHEEEDWEAQDAEVAAGDDETYDEEEEEEDQEEYDEYDEEDLDEEYDEDEKYDDEPDDEEYDEEDKEYDEDEEEDY